MRGGEESEEEFYSKETQSGQWIFKVGSICHACQAACVATAFTESSCSGWLAELDFFLEELKKKLTYFWLHWVLVTLHRLSLVAASSGYSPVVERGLLTAVTSLLRSTGSGAQAQQLWRTGLMALQQVESSRTRD